RANAESVVVRGEQRWVADESRQRVLEVDGQGRVLGEHALPGALSDGAALRSSNSGVEALAHHERYGLVAVTQRPRADDPPGMHVVHAGDATRRHIAMQPGGRSTLKAADLRGNRLRLLEKLDPDVPGAPLRFVLRELDLARACDAAAPCPGPAWELDDPRLAGHNLEGLACLDDEYCVLVSDSAGPSAARPTLFVLVRLPAVPRR
ncbi:MAG: esterase-like activity of phytase family protein, partial [Rubrivivax sp.]|nr:esterase-like activity of phytase family protein [Rubrivivax sp.]